MSEINSAELLARITLLVSDEGKVSSFWAPGQSHDIADKPWDKAYWFDHLDFDHREAAKLQKNAVAGTRGEARVWVRVGEHQLVRADLTIEPLSAPSQSRQILIRTEPTLSSTRRKPGSALETKTLENAPSAVKPPSQPNVVVGQSMDILQQRLPFAVCRIDLASATIIAMNDGFADLLGGTPAAIGKPLVELITPKDQSALSRGLVGLADSSNSDLLIDTQFHTPGTRDTFVRMTVIAEPLRKTAIAVVRDLSHERAMLDLIRKADQLSELSRKGDATLRRLEELVASAPVGLAIFQGGRSVLKNRPFRQVEDAGQLDAASLQQSVDAAQPAVIQPTSFGQARLFVFPIDTQETPGSDNTQPGGALVGVAAILPELIRPSPGTLDQLRRSVEGLPYAAAVMNHSLATPAIECASNSFDLDSVSQAISIPLDDQRTLKLLASSGSHSLLGDRAVDMLGAAPLATLIVDRDLRITHANPAAAALIARGNIQGQLLSDCFANAPVTFEQAAQTPVALFNLVDPHQPAPQEFEASIHPFESSAVVFLSDPIPGRELAKAASRGTLLAAALDHLAPAIGLIEWDVQDGATRLSRAALQLLGHAAGESPSWSSAFNKLDDQDKSRLESVVYVALDQPESRPIKLRVNCGPRTLDLVGLLEWSRIHEAQEEGAKESSGRDKQQTEVTLPRRMLVLISDATEQLTAVGRFEKLSRRLDERNAAINALIEAIPGSVLVQTGDSRLYKNGDAQSLITHGPVDHLTSGVHSVAPRDNLPARVLRVELRPIELDGARIGTAGVELDDTELFAVRAQAAQQGQLLDTLFEKTTLPIALVGPNGRIERTSADFLRITGLTGQAADDTTIDALLITDSNQLTHLTVAGTPVPVWVQRVAIPPAHGAGSKSIVLLNDRTENAALEAQLNRVESQANLLEKRLQSMEESIYDAVLLLNSSGQAIAANNTARSLLDLEDDTTLPAEAFERTLWRDQRKRRLTNADLPWAKVLAGTSQRGVELRARRRRDGLDWHAEIDATPIKDDDEVAAIVIVRDVSIRIELEDDLELARNQLAVANETHRARLLSTDEDVAMLMRQLRSAVQMMMPVANHLALDPRLPDDARQTGRHVLAAVQLQQRLMRIWPTGAAPFEGSGAVTLTERLDVHAMLHASLKQVLAEFSPTPGRTPRLELLATASVVQTDPAKLRQVLWNLLDAATKPADRATPATIVTRNLDASLVIELSDVSGMHPKAVELCKQLVADDGGIFTTESPSNGCSLAMDLAPGTLPMSVDVKPAKQSVPFRILFVEDDAAKKRVLSKTLINSGYEVVGASNVEEANAIVAGTQFDLVLASITATARVGDTVAMMRDLRARRGLVGVAMTNELRSSTELAEAGFVDQILRPIELKLLTVLVDRFRTTRDQQK